MYAYPLTDEPPIFSLLIAGVAQPGEPLNRHTDFPAIKETNVHHMGVKPYFGGPGFSLRYRNIHPISPLKCHRFL